MKQRNRTLDIVKGIGICLVVLGHIQSPTQTYMYGFHMPLFFMLSGMFFKEKYLDESVKYIKSRFQRLLLPFLLINIFAYFVFPHEVAPWWRMFGIVSAIDYPNSMLGAVWFLKTLFVVSLMFYIFLYVVRKLFHITTDYIWPAIFLVVAIVTDYYTGPKISAWLFQCFFFSFGFYIKRYEALLISDVKLSPKAIMVAAVGGGTFVLLNSLREGDINSCRYTGIIPFAITGILGTWFTFRLSSIISQSLPKVATIFSFLGSRTMPIILFHWIAFNILRQLVIYVKPSFCFDSISYRIGLFLIGIMLPIAVDTIFDRVKTYFKK